MPTIRRSFLLLALSLLIAGCQLRIGTDITIEPDGGGRLVLVVAMDEELTELLVDAGADVASGLDELRAAAPSWEIEDAPDAPGRELTFSTDFADPGELERLVRDLQASLGPEDGRLLDGLDVHRFDDGAVAFEAMAGLVPPTTIGATGSGVDIDGDDLRRLLEERGDEFVRYDLRVTLPAEPVSTDADEVDGRTLTWNLPVGEQRAVAARSAVPPGPPWLVIGAAAGAFLVAMFVAARLSRRRRRHREITPAV